MSNSQGKVGEENQNNPMMQRISLEIRGRDPSEIKELVLDNCGRSTTLQGLTDEFSNLKVLSVINVGLTSLKNFPKLPKLKKLYLSDNRLTNGLENLESCSNLSLLVLAGNKFKSVDDLKPLTKLPKLLIVDLMNCEVTQSDGYPDKIFELLPQLKYLDNVDKNGIEAEDDEELLEDEDEGNEEGTHEEGDDEDDEKTGLKALYDQTFEDDDEEESDFNEDQVDSDDEDDDDDLDDDLDESANSDLPHSANPIEESFSTTTTTATITETSPVKGEKRKRSSANDETNTEDETIECKRFLDNNILIFNPMTDVTKLFRTLIKAKRATADIPTDQSSTTNSLQDELGLKRRHLPPRSVHDNNNSNNNDDNSDKTSFTNRAKIILNSIVTLKQFLIDNRSMYLCPKYLRTITSKTSASITDHLRFEQTSEKQIKQYRLSIDQLKVFIGHICYSGQRRLHYESICSYLANELIECTKIYTEEKSLRYKRELERKRIARLDYVDKDKYGLRQNIEPSQKNDTLPTSLQKNTATAKNTPSESATKLDNKSPSYIHVTRNFDNDSDNANTSKNTEEENDRFLSKIDREEQKQLQVENERLYRDVAQRSEEIQQIAEQACDIADMQKRLFDNILAQSDLIDQVDTTAIQTNDDMAAAIKHIRDAVKNSAQMRRWIIFFLLVMIFSLLFLDWYNE
ncbi:unnamed protein product [Didymodactylos carnosus]|uniref:t-SNARE coiled-coil homology domain-containing protein n=1 Tax=Didymodactylos carnosus TaxID=1234261 RepID=A0A813XLF7_9BILA|nr:unnamed protein product [Didymodactylos carnosus]CAF1143941.1 unnamed protein product [Didymodactylos carnosus]CAF3654139.1 unnamed protein product [Didymodactylos carnosus]CAF3943447.1 unnamed protein product [Didymodactylos carnosus]